MLPRRRPGRDPAPDGRRRPGRPPADRGGVVPHRPRLPGRPSCRTACAELTERLRPSLNGHTVRALGFGTAGVVGEGLPLTQSENLPAPERCQDVAELVRAVTPCPVRLENDARCFTLAEARFGAGRGAGRLRHHARHGAGCGVMTGGRLPPRTPLPGGRGVAHPDARPQPRALPLGRGGRARLRQRPAERPRGIDAAEVVEARAAGDAAARQAWSTFAEDLVFLCETIVWPAGPGRDRDRRLALAGERSLPPAARVAHGRAPHAPGRLRARPRRRRHRRGGPEYRLAAISSRRRGRRGPRAGRERRRWRASLAATSRQPDSGASFPSAEETISIGERRMRSTILRTSCTSDSACANSAPPRTISDGSTTGAHVRDRDRDEARHLVHDLLRPAVARQRGLEQRGHPAGRVRLRRLPASGRPARGAPPGSRRQPRSPKSTSMNCGPMHMTAISPAMKWWPWCSSPSISTPAPMPVPTKMNTQVSCPRAAPRQCSPSTARFTSFSTWTGPAARAQDVAHGHVRPVVQVGREGD